MAFKPLHDRVALQPMQAEEKTKGGIIIPDTAAEKPLQGKVIAVGSGARDNEGKLIPMEIKVGDIVVYGKWGGNDIKVEGQDIVVIKESDVLGILN